MPSIIPHLDGLPQSPQVRLWLSKGGQATCHLHSQSPRPALRFFNPYKLHFHILKIFLLFIHLGAYIYGTAGHRMVCAVTSLLPPRGFRPCQVWWLVPLSNEPSHPAPSALLRVKNSALTLGKHCIKHNMDHFVKSFQQLNEAGRRN